MHCEIHPQLLHTENLELSLQHLTWNPKFRNTNCKPICQKARKVCYMLKSLYFSCTCLLLFSHQSIIIEQLILIRYNVQFIFTCHSFLIALRISLNLSSLSFSSFNIFAILSLSSSFFFLDKIRFSIALNFDLSNPNSA